MINIIEGGRQSGRTTRLIQLAHKNDAQLISPTWQMASTIARRAAQMNITLKHKPTHIGRWPELLGRSQELGLYRINSFMLDELEMCLEGMRVIAAVSRREADEI